MTVKLVCARCGATLAPAMSGLRCPRFTACGRGGYEETLGREWAIVHARADPALS